MRSIGNNPRIPVMRLRFIHILCLVCLASPAIAFAAADTSYTMIGTYYADFFVGRKTSNGEIFSHEKFTCAHKTIPLGTYVEVTNPKTDKKVVLKVNDRCPKNNVLDMTRAAIAAIGIKGAGKVQVRILGDVKLKTEPSTLRPYNPEEPPYGSVAYNEYNSRLDEAENKKTGKTNAIAAKTKKTATTKTKNNKKVKEKPKETPKPVVKRKPDYYDVLLSTERTLSSARLHASVLDPVYIPNLEYKELANGKYQIIIRLAMTKDQLEPLLEEIELSFPRLQLIPAEE